MGCHSFESWAVRTRWHIEAKWPSISISFLQPGIMPCTSCHQLNSESSLSILVPPLGSLERTQKFFRLYYVQCLNGQRVTLKQKWYTVLTQDFAICETLELDDINQGSYEWHTSLATIRQCHLTDPVERVSYLLSHCNEVPLVFSK